MPMSILASVCWKAGSVWLCCGRVCGIPRVFALLRALACACVCVCVLVWRAWSRGCLGVCGGAALVCAAPLWCVVAVSYSPTPPGVQYHWRCRA